MRATPRPTNKNRVVHTIPGLVEPGTNKITGCWEYIIHDAQLSPGYCWMNGQDKAQLYNDTDILNLVAIRRCSHYRKFVAGDLIVDRTSDAYHNSLSGHVGFID